MRWKMTSPTLTAAIVLASSLWLAACSQSTGPSAPDPATAPAPGVAVAPAPASVAAPPIPVPVLPPIAGSGAAGGGAPPGAGEPASPPVFRPAPLRHKRARPPVGSEAPEPAGGGQPAPAPIPGPRAADSSCGAAGLAPFPWPDPPQPSGTATIAPYLLSGSADSRPATLQGVAARLEGAIAGAGYLQPKYLGAGCNGFAIVLDLEHIDADGTRARGAAGFAPPGQDESFSLATYVRRLFYAPPGHYRQIVFVVSDQRLGRTTAPPTEAELRAITRDGVSALPARYAALPYTPRHVVLALIYEFDKGPRDGDAKVIPPQGRLGAAVHLKKAQLF